jgi:hypothetical protein
VLIICGSPVWVERTRTRAARVADDQALADLTTFLGSGFNLSVARALRSRVALFVEGEDMKLLRILARKLSATRFSAESSMTVIPIGGFTHWPSVEAFAWVKSELLGAAVEVRLLLDRDYRSQQMCDELQQQLMGNGVKAHVWSRKELESYVLEPVVIARLTGLTLSDVDALMMKIATGMRNSVVAQLVKYELDNKEKGVDFSTATQGALASADRLFENREELIGRLPAKDVLSELNKSLQEQGRPTLTSRKLAAALRPEEIPAEMAQVIMSIEEALATPLRS